MISKQHAKHLFAGQNTQQLAQPLKLVLTSLVCLFNQLVSKDMRSSSLDSTSYMSPASAVLAAAAAAVAEANGGHEDHRGQEDLDDGHTSFLTYDQGTAIDQFFL